MAENVQEDVSSVDSTTTDAHDLPMSTSAIESERSVPSRLFRRERSVYELLGGGCSADVILWRKKHLSAGILASATVFFVLLKFFDFTLVQLVSTMLMILMTLLFLWSNFASLLNRPPPSIPDMHVSEDAASYYGKKLSSKYNHAFACFHKIVLGKDFMLFLKLAGGLYLLSIIGGWFEFITVVYSGLVAILVFPVIYEKYEDKIDKYAQIAISEVNKYYKKAEAMLKKVPRAAHKEKKAQ